MSIDREQTHIEAEELREAVRRGKIVLRVLYGSIVATWIFFTLAVPAAGILMPLMFFLAPLGMLWVAIIAWVAVPAAGAVATVSFLWARSYRSAAISALVPAAGVILALYGIEIGDVVDFWLNKARFDLLTSDVVRGRCSAEDRKRWNARTIYYECRAPAIVAFEHDRMLSTWRGFIYDASDEIAKPPSERSAAWKNRDIAEFVCDAETRVALDGHYYIVFGNFGGCD